jgi:hypothetical protein
MNPYLPQNPGQQCPRPGMTAFWYFFTRSRAGTHFGHGYRPEFILGPANGRTRGPV